MLLTGCRGEADYSLDGVSIVSGTINFNDTSIPSELAWQNEAGDVTYGRVRLDGCQLQAID